MEAFLIILSGRGENIMISVILPTYNGEKYIKQSVESVLWQTYTDWELVIVDDCSTDSTGSIVDGYAKKDSRIKVIHNGKNMKLPSSLNIGFTQAKGELFTWTSDDNAFAPEAFERLSDNITNNRVDFIFSNYEVIDPDDYIIYQVETGPVDELPLKDTIGACFLYKRKIHEVLGGYDVNKFLVEDYDFWLRAYWKFSFMHLDESLYYYRMHGSSLTAERKGAIERETIKLLEENIDKVNNSGLYMKIKEKIENYYVGAK